MKQPLQRTLFLARTSYRQRRLRDALRMLPVLGVILWLLPLMAQGKGAEGGQTASVGFYIFVVWLLLIVLSAMMARFLTPDAGPGPVHDDSEP